jgi:hypothetical protein
MRGRTWSSEIVAVLMLILASLVLSCAQAVVGASSASTKAVRIPKAEAFVLQKYGFMLNLLSPE